MMTNSVGLIRSLLLSSVLLAQFVSGSQEMIVKPAGEVFTKATGSSIVFTCELIGDQSDSASAPELKWYHDSREITDKMTSRIYVEEDSATIKKLYITEIREEDQGNYSCNADVDGTPQKKSFNLSLYKEITFDYAPEVQHPAINTDAVIKCLVSGRPEPQLSWRYKGVRLTMGGKHEIVKDGLLIRNITLQDDGSYTCRAEIETEGRYNEQKISVAVHIPPDMTVGPGLAEGVEGRDLSISCSADGLPLPEFQYYKEGSTSPLISSDRVQIDYKSGSITFKPLKKEDEGNYTCLAYNDVGNSSAVGKIIVNVKPSIHDFQNVSVKDGGTLTMVCASKGDPQPNMTIQKVGSSEVYPSGDNKEARITISRSEPYQASLVFNSITLEDSGFYVCKVENKLGSDEKEAKLTVTYRPRFALDHPKSVYIWAGVTRNITCDILAEPEPTVMWLRGESTIISNDTFHIFTEGRKSSLQVRVLESDQSWIYGVYSCEANNEWGGNKIDIELIRATVPDSPQLVNVSESSQTEVTLVVEPPLNDGGEKIKGYRASFFEKPTDTNVSFAGNAVDQGAEYSHVSRNVEVQDTNKIAIGDLKPNTTYVFSVKAKNDVGYGNPREVSVTTEAVRKPSPIEITSDEQGDAFGYTITWKKPVAGGLPIKEYEIKHREVKVDESGKQTFGPWSKITVIQDPKRPVLTHDLLNLQPKTTYQLQVLVLNDEGWSEVNPEFQFHTREATPSEVADMQAASVGSGAIVGIVVVIFVVLLVIVDISCYFVNNCGVTMCICVHLCGKSATFTKEKAMEEGESKEVLKQPIETYQTEEGAPDGSGEPPVPAYTESKEQCLKTEDDKETQKEKEKLADSLKEGMEGQKEEIDSAEVAGDIKSDLDKSEKAPIV